jgi:hypothetical protein
MGFGIHGIFLNVLIEAIFWYIYENNFDDIHGIVFNNLHGIFPKTYMGLFLKTHMRFFKWSFHFVIIKF